MIQQKWYPRAELLRKYINLYSIVRIGEGGLVLPRAPKAVPYGMVNLIFCFGFTFRYYNDRVQVTTGSHFKGPHLDYYHVDYEGSIDLLLINFKPYGLYPFIHTPVDRLYGQILEVAAVDPRFADMERLIRNSADDEAKISILEECMLEMVNPNRLDLEDIISAANLIDHRKGLLGIEDLLNKSYMNRRTLERKFRNMIGLTPKNYIRLIRFENALKQVRMDQSERHWVEVALEGGYYDQSHFIRDFKEFMGNPPETYLSKRDLLLDIFRPF